MNILREKYISEHKRLENAIKQEAKRVIEFLHPYKYDGQSYEKFLQNWELEESFIYHPEDDSEHGSVEFIYKYRNSRYDDESNWFVIPFRLLFDREELKKEVEKIKQEILEKEARKKALEEEKAMLAKERRKKAYLELKREFENNEE